MFKALYFALLILILTHSTVAQAKDTPSDLAQLQGLWSQGCQGSVVRSEAFKDSSVALNEEFFLDAACSKPLMVFRNKGHFVLPQMGQMDFSFSAVTMTLQHFELVERFNARNVCGFSDWKMNEEKEISGRSCEIFTNGFPQRIPTAGDKRYGIYHLEDDQLQFGKLSREFDATTPEKRPRELDPRTYRKLLAGF